MRAVVIGGTGHIGGHLIPMLVKDGISTVVITRGESPMPAGQEWSKVTVARASYQRGAAQWTSELREILKDGDTLIDILGTDLAATYSAAKGRCAHVINCGSVWMLGTARRVPFVESSSTTFWGESYQSRWRVIQETVAESQRAGNPAFTAILPPNICGPGKIPLDTKGGRSLDVHRELAQGKEVIVPEGADVLIGPCDAEDIARAFYLAVVKPHCAAAQIFNVGSAYALTASEFVEAYARIYGVEIPVRRVPWREFATSVVPDPGSRYHFEAHMCPDISKLRLLLGYEPKHTPEQSMWRAVNWMRERRML